MSKSSETLDLGGIDFHLQTSLQQQVRDKVLRQIESGAWRPEQRLPSDEALARELGVHYHTVRLALSSLAQEGNLVRHRGRGTFVADHCVRQHTGVLFGSDLNHFHAMAFNTLFAKHVQDYFHGEKNEVKMYFVQRWLRDRQGVCNDDFARDIAEGALRACLVVGGAQFVAAENFDLLLRHRIPFVLGTAFPTDFPSVCFDLRGLVERGMERLIAGGYRRIAIVYGRYPEAPVLPTEEIFYQSYQRALAKAGLMSRREWIKDEREPGQETGYHAMKELWALGANRPEAVLSCDNVITQGMIHAWWELGIQVPRDLGFITHSNKEVPILYPTPLTRLACDVRELVEAAGRMLLALAEGRPLKSQRMIVPVRLVAGRSCGENQ